MVPTAGIFPAELTALRSAGLLLAIFLVAYAVFRRRSLRNADVLILIASGLGLALVSGTEIVNGLLSAFSFEKGNGGRILGLAVFAIFILFLLALRALSQGARNSRQLAAALEGLAWEEFRQAGLPERFRDKIAILIPAYNEAENIGTVLDQIPPGGLRRRAPRSWSSTTAPATAPARSPPSTAPRSPATSPTAAAALRCAPATG